MPSKLDCDMALILSRKKENDFLLKCVYTRNKIARGVIGRWR
jgi:hypothetical protein